MPTSVFLVALDRSGVSAGSPGDKPNQGCNLFFVCKRACARSKRVLWSSDRLLRATSEVLLASVSFEFFYDALNIGLECVEAGAFASSIASASATSASTCALISARVSLMPACFPRLCTSVVYFDEQLQTGIERCAEHEILAKLRVEQLGPRVSTCPVCGG